MKKTPANFAKHLNETVTPDIESEEWIIGGKNRSQKYFGWYGIALWRYDPIGFRVGYQDWKRRTG